MDHPTSSVCLFFFHCAFHSVTESQAGNCSGYISVDFMFCTICLIFYIIYIPFCLHLCSVNNNIYFVNYLTIIIIY